MKNNDSKEWLISVCGLNCAKCNIYLAAHGDKKLMNKIIEWFKKEMNKDIKPNQITCEGCRGSLDVHWSPYCKIMLCAREKEIQYCFQCDDFPCSLINEFSSDGVPHHERTVKNMKRIKKSGLMHGLKSRKRKEKSSSVRRIFVPKSIIYLSVY